MRKILVLSVLTVMLLQTSCKKDVQPIAMFDYNYEFPVLQLRNESINGLEFTWIYSDGFSESYLNSSRVIIEPGEYTITLVAKNGIYKDQHSEVVIIP